MATPVPTPQRPPIHHRVTIVSGNPPQVVPAAPIQLSRGNDDTLSWNCADNFVVCFGKKTGTPFHRVHFHRGLPNSGAIRRDAALGAYDYTVETAAGVLDPQVIIDP